MSETADAASPRVDPALPIRPIDQPARLTALEAAVRARTPLVPEVGIVLGSGLGGLADDLVAVLDERRVPDPCLRAVQRCNADVYK